MATIKNDWLSKVNPNIILWGAGIWLGYKYVVSPLLETVGLKDSATDIANNAAPVVAGNPWTAAFYQSPAAKAAGAYLFTRATAEALCKTINGYQGLFSDNFNTAFGVIQQCKTKSQLSFLCDVFQQLYNGSLYNFLKEGNNFLPWFGMGLSAEHIGQINTYVNNLPNYRP